MFYEEHLPHKSLRNCIRCYWTLSISEPTEVEESHAFLAEGMELSFNLGDPIEVLNQSSGSFMACRSCVCGPMTQPMQMRPSGRVEILGVCFRPGGAYPFFSYPAAELVDGRGEVEDFWGSKGSEIVNGIRGEYRTMEEKMHFLERYFMRKLDQSPGNDRRMSAALCEIEANKGRIRISSLAESVGLSSRQLERLFKERVGLSPKQLCRGLRFKNLFKLLAASSPDSSALAAIDCGYFDQAHMIRDFKYYTGLTPAAYFTRQSAGGGFFTGNSNRQAAAGCTSKEP